MSAPQILRASPTDRAMLAMGCHGAVPEQIGILLRLQPPSLRLSRLRTVLDERSRSVPRLRRRLVRVPPGCGGPIWIDEPQFDICRHVRPVTVPDGASDQQLYDVALAAVMTPLAPNAPPWAVVLLTTPNGPSPGLVFVMHHVLTDGLGGLALLADLVDPGPPPAESAVPVPRPTRRDLAAQAMSQRGAALRGVRHGWTEVQRSLGAAGGWRPPPADPCSLLGTTGARRQMVVVSAELAVLKAAARQHQATINDVVLVIIGTALANVLAARSEAVDPLLVVVPVSGRRTDDPTELGNVVAPLLVPVPTVGSVHERIARVAEHVRTQKESAAGPPPIATLGWLFRPLAASGAYRWYMNHQRRLHTLVTNVHGPKEAICLDGVTVTSATPISVGDNGNVTAHFTVMSYAGIIAITVVVDPDRFQDLDVLTDALRDQIRAFR